MTEPPDQDSLPPNPSVEELQRQFILACENISMINGKNHDLTKALASSLSLIDELLTELGKLCSATNMPPPMSIFSAKHALDANIRKILELSPENKT